MSSRLGIAIIILPLILFLLFSVFTLASANEFDTSTNEEWRTAYAVGRFLNSDPPKVDQVFIIKYRAVNATLESFDLTQKVQGGIVSNGFLTRVNSTDGGTLEVMYPRNFPYTNSGSGMGNFVFFIDNWTIENTGITTDCFFVFSIPFRGSVEIELGLTSILVSSPYHGDSIPDSCIPQTISEQNGYGPPRHLYSVEQLTECRNLGIDEENCTDMAIYQKSQLKEDERRLIEEQQIQISNAKYLIGIGAAIAVVFAFVTLRKKS